MLTKKIINNFNNKKITPIKSELNDVKVFTTKENIATLKENYKNHVNIETQKQSVINSYEMQLTE